jgi:very-short-patch-repair endonuclease
VDKFLLVLAQEDSDRHHRIMPQFRPRQTKRAQELRNNATEAEQRLWGRLRHRRLAGFKFSRQMAVGPFVCDFLCRERGLVVELDGGQHADRTVEDDRRTSYLNARGMVVLRFWNNEVFQNIEGVLHAIRTQLEALPARFDVTPLQLAAEEELQSGEGVGQNLKRRAHPQPPPASGRGLT